MPKPTRRDALKLAATALLPQADSRAKGAKRIIVAGAGIGGLSCAWELVRRGHEVTVVEASARTGGHVFTFRDGLDDGLYADGGAEHFTEPGTSAFASTSASSTCRTSTIRAASDWFDGSAASDTPRRCWPIAKVLAKLGLNSREVEYLTSHPFAELAALYFAPYVDSFQDEYRHSPRA